MVTLSYLFEKCYFQIEPVLEKLDGRSGVANPTHTTQILPLSSLVWMNDSQIGSLSLSEEFALSIESLCLLSPHWVSVNPSSWRSGSSHYRPRFFLATIWAREDPPPTLLLPPHKTPPVHQMAWRLHASRGTALGAPLSHTRRLLLPCRRWRCRICRISSLSHPQPPPPPLGLPYASSGS